jgi:hypothetical protein
LGKLTAVLKEGTEPSKADFSRFLQSAFDCAEKLSRLQRFLKEW